jgi:hypothetical protein
MTWKPSKAELELIADAGCARQPADKIAATLGVTEAEFMTWASSLIAARSVPRYAPPMPPVAPQQPPPVPQSSRAVANRVFERPSVAGQETF